jgi:hypothetical protein
MKGVHFEHFASFPIGFRPRTTFLLAAGLGQSLGTAAGIINTIALLVMFAGRLDACLSALIKLQLQRIS